MPKPIALQLYTLRELLAQDFAGTLRRVAALGYAGVETAGQYGESPASARRLLDSLGLTVCGAHLPLPVGPNQKPVIETAQALGCTRIVCAWLPPERFASAEGLRAVCAELNAASEVARAHGLTLGYHNHWFEFDQRVAGRPAHDWMAEWLDPAIFFEVDVYWVKTAGQDPAKVVRRLGARAPLLHLKDGPAVQEAPMTAVGAGTLDFGPILAAAGQAEWLIVELDRCATDLLTAVADSHRYLTARGWGHGKN